jgi:phage tail sheath protein FI
MAGGRRHAFPGRDEQTAVEGQMAVRLTYPGVYVVEQASGVRTISGVSTSTALFVGMTERGPVGQPVALRTADQFDDRFGGSVTFGEMAVQVRQFFLNGGAEAYVIRPRTAGMEQAAITLQNEAGADVLRLRAREPGLAGSALRVVIDYDTPTPERTFNLEVFRRTEGPGGAVTISENEFYADLTMDDADPRHVGTVLANQSALVEPDDTAAIALTLTGPGFSQGGLILDGADDEVAATTLQGLLAEGRVLRVSVDGGTPVTVTLPDIPAPVGPASLADFLTAAETAINTALEADGQAGRVAVTLQAFGGGRSLRIASTAAERAGVTVTPAPTASGAGRLQLGAAAGGIELSSFSPLRPRPSGYVTTLSTAAGSADLGRIGAVAAADRAGVRDWSFTDGTTEGTGTGGVTFAGAGTRFREGAASDAGIGSLQNLAAHLTTLAASIGAPVAQGWSVRRIGLRLSFQPRGAAPNAGLAAAYSTGDGGGGGQNLGAAGAIADPAQARGPAAYSLGTAGLGAGQTDGLDGADGGIPELADYDAAFTVARREIDLFNLMLLPRGPGQTDAARALLWGAASAFCQQVRAFLLVDPPSEAGTGWGDVDAVREGIAALRLGMVTDHAAVYWPRLRGASRTGAIDPCGTVAGIMARTDTRRGVWKAPAGVEAATLGARGFEHAMSDPENGVINPQAVNALRQFASGGVVWGARTMAGFDNSGSEYNYVPVRRTALFLQESLYRGLQFAVFEPNDEPLWAQIRLAAGAFMHNLFRQGAFQGAKASDAYLVRCDETTTTQNDINLGRVNVLVGFAPLKPAEFVVLTVRQLAGQVQS